MITQKAFQTYNSLYLESRDSTHPGFRWVVLGWCGSHPDHSILCARQSTTFRELSATLLYLANLGVHYSFHTKVLKGRAKGEAKPSFKENRIQISQVPHLSNSHSDIFTCFCIGTDTHAGQQRRPRVACSENFRRHPHRARRPGLQHVSLLSDASPARSIRRCLLAPRMGTDRHTRAVQDRAVCRCRQSY